MAQQHLMMQDGQMYQLQNQEKTKLNQQLRLKNGMTINPDGSGAKKNGKQFRLQNGECLDMDGNRYENQERYMEKMEMHNREKMNKEMNKEKGKENKAGKSEKNQGKH